ncbi:MAG: type II secretion system protein [Candidatus Hydrogenedentota bacterium]
MKRKLGFTLIELLVVIAIISILAAIVVPNVNNWIARARMTNTVSEVQGIELAMTQMLNDAERQNARDIFDRFPSPQELAGIVGPQHELYADELEAVRAWLDVDENSTFEAEVELYTRAFYSLLRQGRNAGDSEHGDPGAVRLTFGEEGEESIVMWVGIDPEVRPNLGTSYMDIGRDPWDNRFRIWPGPWNREMQSDYGPPRDDEQSDENLGIGQFAPLDENSRFVPIPFRSFREGVETEDGEWIPYQYTSEERNRAEQEVPGNPRADNRYGFPAPDGQQFYIYSRGADGESNQNYRLPDGHLHPDYVYDAPFDVERVGGGDDINNWDNQQGWSRWYTN